MQDYFYSKYFYFVVFGLVFNIIPNLNLRSQTFYGIASGEYVSYNCLLQINADSSISFVFNSDGGLTP